MDLELATGPVRIEYAWLDAAPADAPVMVFLHEGLGSLAMWKDYPAQLCAAVRCRGLVYSRPGYGQSQPLHAQQPWGADFMHIQAYEVLPALLTALGLAPLEISTRRPPDAGACPAPASAPLILFGHSDGASIALLFAARYPQWPAAVVAVAPHLFVEDKTLSAIAGLQAPQLKQPLLVRLARHHLDPDAVFTAWSQVWLAPEFAAWSITDTIATLRCPVLTLSP
jgi:pimeloyl-ACP methyl ester carboxylesterase